MVTRLGIGVEFDDRAAILDPPARVLHPGRRNFLEAGEIRTHHRVEADRDAARPGKYRILNVPRPIEDDARKVCIGTCPDTKHCELLNVYGRQFLGRRRRKVRRRPHETVRREIDGELVRRGARVQAHILSERKTKDMAASIGASACNISRQALNDGVRVDRDSAVERNRQDASGERGPGAGRRRERKDDTAEPIAARGADGVRARRSGQKSERQCRCKVQPDMHCHLRSVHRVARPSGTVSTANADIAIEA